MPLYEYLYLYGFCMAAAAYRSEGAGATPGPSGDSCAANKQHFKCLCMIMSHDSLRSMSSMAAPKAAMNMFAQTCTEITCIYIYIYYICMYIYMYIYIYIYVYIYIYIYIVCISEIHRTTVSCNAVWARNGVAASPSTAINLRLIVIYVYIYIYM